MYKFKISRTVNTFFLPGGCRRDEGKEIDFSLYDVSTRHSTLPSSPACCWCRITYSLLTSVNKDPRGYKKKSNSPHTPFLTVYCCYVRDLSFVSVSGCLFSDVTTFPRMHIFLLILITVIVVLLIVLLLIFYNYFLYSYKHYFSCCCCYYSCFNIILYILAAFIFLLLLFNVVILRTLIFLHYYI